MSKTYFFYIILLITASLSILGCAEKKEPASPKIVSQTTPSAEQVLALLSNDVSLIRTQLELPDHDAAWNSFMNALPKLGFTQTTTAPVLREVPGTVWQNSFTKTLIKIAPDLEIFAVIYGYDRAIDAKFILLAFPSLETGQPIIKSITRGAIAEYEWKGWKISTDKKMVLMSGQ